MIIFEKFLTERQEIVNKIFNSKNLLLTYFNQNCFNIYFNNDSYKKLINENFIVYIEGIGMNLFYKIILKKKIERIDASFLYDIIDKIINHSESTFLVGANFSEEIVNKIYLNFGSNFAGYHRGFFNDAEKKDMINKISNSTARFILIGMGVPKQEIFAFELSRMTHNKIIICVGNFFEFYFGTMKRAPIFFQNLGLEWLFRLFTEPKRLWKRYIIGIPEFIFRALKYRLSNK